MNLASPPGRLDDIAEIDAVDFLKIDVQGSELRSFAVAATNWPAPLRFKPKSRSCTLYVGQPVFGDVDLELRGLGFVPHTFAAVKNSLSRVR